MKVMILCGGYGARLAGVGVDVPKPMVPVGGKPMAWHIMKGFAHWGFDDFVLCLGYRSDLFRQYFLNLSMMVEDVALDLSTGSRSVLHGEQPLDWKITLADTGHDSMTGYRIKLADLLKDGDVRANAFVRPGDVIIIPQSFF